MVTKDLNRLKLVLVEKKKTGVWLSEQLGVSPVTVSKWCSNITQPTIYRRQRNIGCPAPPQVPPIPPLVPPVQESDTTDDLPF